MCRSQVYREGWCEIIRVDGCKLTVDLLPYDSSSIWSGCAFVFAWNLLFVFFTCVAASFHRRLAAITTPFWLGGLYMMW